jgi:hypothetical protein
LDEAVMAGAKLTEVFFCPLKFGAGAAQFVDTPHALTSSHGTQDS